MRPHLRYSTTSMRILFLLALLVCTSCQLPGAVEQLLAGDQAKAQEIAERLGVEPTWEAIARYPERNCVPGMTREEVLAKLGNVGTYKTHDTAGGGRVWDATLGQHVYVVSVYFADEVIHRHLGWYSFAFDDSGRLVRASWLHFP